MELNITKLQAHVKILEDKSAQHTTRYLTLDEEINTIIQTTCPEELRTPLLELWRKDCKREEDKSTEIVEKKKYWLRNLPNEEKERKTEQTKQNDMNQGRQPNNRSNDNHSQFDNTENNGYSNKRKNYGPKYTTQKKQWGRTNDKNTIKNRKYSSYYKPEFTKHKNYNTNRRTGYYNERQQNPNTDRVTYNRKQTNYGYFNNKDMVYNRNQMNNIQYTGNNIPNTEFNRNQRNNIPTRENVNIHRKYTKQGPNRDRNYFLGYGNGGRNVT